MSITLTALATLGSGGVTVESDANAELYYFELSFPSSVRLFYGFGTTQNDFLALVNVAETFAVNNSIVAGTQVPWTSSVY